ISLSAVSSCSAISSKAFNASSTGSITASSVAVSFCSLSISVSLSAVSSCSAISSNAFTASSTGSLMGSSVAVSFC
ncbi:hypothetical protein PZH37_19595, partial [[Eubacterium] siraeum]|nr:hypothetical protein [[Eubacterium] siraeum]